MSDSSGLSVRLEQAGPIPLAVAFSCPPGQVLALVGPSGAGKSTILRSIAGLYRPRSGRITADGEVWLDTETGIFRPPHQRRVGLVFQSYALFPHLTAAANVAAALGHLPRAQRSAAAAALLARVHLDGLGTRKPSELSGGQQQRVALARALARNPLALLLDEPLSAVDRRTRRALQAEILGLRREISIPIVLVTHDVDEATALADHLVVIDHGRILQQGPTAEVIASPASVLVREILDLPPDEYV